MMAAGDEHEPGADFAANPYAPPTVCGTSAADEDDACLVRQRHLHCEQQVRWVASVYALAGALCGAYLLVQTLNRSPMLIRDWLLFGPGVVAATWVGFALRRFCAGARNLATAGALAFGYGLFPGGVLLSALVVYTLRGPGSNVVFSASYPRIMAQTRSLRPTDTLLRSLLWGVTLVWTLFWVLYRFTNVAVQAVPL